MGKSIPMNMDRLKTDFAGIKMPTPVMGASGTFGFGVEYDDFIDLKQVGAIISKGITPLPRAGNPGVRIAETPAGMLNCIGLENPGIEKFLSDVLPKVKEKAPDTTFIVNFSAGSVEEFGMMAKKFDGKKDYRNPSFKMMVITAADCTLSGMKINSGMKNYLVEGLLEMANGHFFKGIIKMMKRVK